MTQAESTDPTSPEGWANRWAPTTATKPPVRTIDVHTHLLVPESAEMTRPYYDPKMDPRTFFSSERSKGLNQRFYAEVAAKFTDPEARILDMDALGIDIQVIGLSPFHYFYWADEHLSPRVASLQNETIADTVATDPTRFVGLGTLPMAHPEAACAEAERVSKVYGFPGVEIGADVNGLDLDDEMFEPLWETLAGLGLAIVLHPAGFTHGQRMSDYYLVNVIGMPLSSTLTVTRMILGGVFERHPDLKMLVVHGGGYLPFYAARTDHAFKHRPELRDHIDRPPSEYLNRLYYDITVFDPALLWQLIDTYGADHVLLGTDYPFDMGLPDPLGFVEDASLSDTDRDLVVGGSAARLFGIDDRQAGK
ncbi:MAG: amidohydrolase family protein [Acidimicrobiia bacterium]|nr:amidohydrolase family protein [Acidimicrobiia bacterium]